jgi:hypothetical protein
MRSGWLNRIAEMVDRLKVNRLRAEGIDTAWG